MLNRLGTSCPGLSRYFLTVALTTLILAIPLTTTCGVKNMSTSDLYNRLESVDFDVLDEIASLETGAAFELLEKGLKHPNEDVRELSVLALEKRPEPKGLALLLDALKDDDLSVQMVAVEVISKRPFSHIVSDLQHVLMEIEPEIQAEIVLLIGLADDKTQKDFLGNLLPKAQRQNEEELSQNIVLAMARLGDSEAQQQIIRKLQSEDVADQRDAIEDLEYINDAKLLVHLKPLLNDTTDAMDIGKTPKNFYLRICDLAVLCVQKITKFEFSFVTTRGRQFTKEERCEVALHIKGAIP